MIWSALALAAPPDPKTAEDVDALVASLYAPTADARIAAATALLHTPPELVTRLEPGRIACFAHPSGAGCEWHNHAVYQLERVLIGLANRELEPGSPYAAECDRSEHTCPALRALWQMAMPMTGLSARGDDELPPGSTAAVHSDVLQREIEVAVDERMTALPPGGAADWRSLGAMEAVGASWRWDLLPRCASGGFYGPCRWLSRVEGPRGVSREVLVGWFQPPWITDQEQVTIRDGLGFYSVVGELGGTGDASSVGVVDLATNQAKCVVRVEGGEGWSAEQRAALVAQIRLEGGKCVVPPQAGVTVEAPDR